MSVGSGKSGDLEPVPEKGLPGEDRSGGRLAEPARLTLRALRRRLSSSRGALLVAALPRGAAFDWYGNMLRQVVVRSGGTVGAAIVDPVAEPQVLELLGVSGAPAVGLFIGGTRVASFAAPLDPEVAAAAFSLALGPIGASLRTLLRATFKASGGLTLPDGMPDERERT